MTASTLPARTAAGTPDLLAQLNGHSRPRSTNKGRKFPPDPIRVEEFAALLEACVPLVPGWHGHMSAGRLRALIVLLYRTGIRISEALALEENDLDQSDQAIVIKRGKGGKRRVVLIDDWGWHELTHWLERRAALPPGAIICLIRGQHAGRPLSATDARRQLRDARARAGLRRRVNPHAFRHGFAVESRREGIDLHTLQRQLGHARLDVTEIYFRGIDPLETLAPIRRREPPRIEVPAAR